MSNDMHTSDPTKSQRCSSQSPTNLGSSISQDSQDKSKKTRASSCRNGAGKGSIMTMPHLLPGEEITYTPTTHRISKAKKGKKVHNCTFPGCPKIFTRAEHRKRHEANHNAHPAFQCQMEGCKKPFQRADLLARHMERQHNMPMDASSTRSGRSRGSMSDYSASPGASNFRMPHFGQQHTSSSLPPSSTTMSINSLIEASNYDSEYRTHSVPPSLHDHLSSQPIGTGPRSMRPEMLYGLSPSGDSIYSSSDSCYSPISEYLQGPPPMSQQYQFGPEIVHRPHSAVETCYSLETSPLSIGPPTPVDGPSWSSYDHAALGCASETHCLPSQRQFHQCASPPWTGSNQVSIYDGLAPQSAWAWSKLKY